MTREEEAKSYLAVLGFSETLKERVEYDVVVALMLVFADAEAAAMRERAAECAEGHIGAWSDGSDPDGCECVHPIAADIRALPATGEVGRG